MNLMELDNLRMPVSVKATEERIKQASAELQALHGQKSWIWSPGEALVLDIQQSEQNLAALQLEKEALQDWLIASRAYTPLWSELAVVQTQELWYVSYTFTPILPRYI